MCREGVVVAKVQGVKRQKENRRFYVELLCSLVPVLKSRARAAYSTKTSIDFGNADRS